MSNSDEGESQAMVSKNRQLWLLKPRSFTIKMRIRFVLFIITLIAVGAIIISTYIFQRNIAVHKAYDELYVLRNAKTKLLNDYFTRLTFETKTFAGDRKTLDAFTSFDNAYHGIESDNYATSMAGNPKQVEDLIKGFYTTDVLPVLENKTGEKPDISLIMPSELNRQILQCLYLAENSKPFGYKQQLNKASDSSNYSSVHSQYHPEILQIARQYGLSDVLLVDYTTGDVVYSLAKNLDFATNLREGPFKNSASGNAFKAACSAGNNGYIHYEDVSIYAPALMKPVIFISSPIFSNNKMAGVAIFEIDVTLISKLLNFEGNDDSFDLNHPKTIMVGEDLLFRSDDPGLIYNHNKYLKSLNKGNLNAAIINRINQLNTDALLQKVDNEVFINATRDLEGSGIYKTETGKVMFCSYGPTSNNALNWILVCQLEKYHIMHAANLTLLLMIGLTILIFALLFLYSRSFSNSISAGVNTVKDALVVLSSGQKLDKINYPGNDELGHTVEFTNKLSERINEATQFADQLGLGNLDVNYTVIDSEDHFGISLNKLKDSLLHARIEEEKRKQEDDIRNWTTHGIAMFNDILREDNDNINKLALSIIKNLIEYLKANQGGVFMLEDDDDKALNLVAAYAFDRQKFQKKRIGIGEGLAGTCALEKKTIYVKQIPDNYIEITSGLGGAKPSSLLIVPLKKDEEVLGIIELASFNELQQHEIDFVEKVAESIAVTMVTVRLNMQTAQFLEKFQQQAEEMKAQDEELRQNLEELQATQEQMERLKQEENERSQNMIREMDNFRKLLINVLNEIPEKVYLKDDKGRFIIANKQVADTYNRSVEEILGKSDFDFYPNEEAAELFKHEQEIINSNKAQLYEEGDPSKSDKAIVRSIKKPFYVEHMGITGLFAVQFDITDIKRKEYEARKLAEDLDKNQKELERNRRLIIHILDRIPAKIFLKDENGVFVIVNSAVANVYHKSVDEIIGTSDFDNHPDEDVESWRKQELEIMATGEQVYFHTEKINGKTQYLKTIKMPFRIATTGKLGLLGIQYDVSDTKILEEKISELQKEIDDLHKNRGKA